MYTINSFAKDIYMRKLTKILLIIFVLTLVPTLIMGKSIIKGIVPQEKGFAFNFDTQGIIALVLLVLTLINGIYLYIRFVMSQPVDKAIFFSSLPLVIIYGATLFLLAGLVNYTNKTATSVKTLLNISADNLYNTILWAVLITLLFIALLFVNCFVLCKPLNKVERIVSRLGDGKVRDEKLKIGGVKQFNSIEHSLNKINNNYRSKDNSLRQVNLETQKFIPKQFFKFLGKSNIQELELGNQVKKKATVMLVKLVGIEDGKNITLEESFDYINSYMHIISPLIRKFGGFIDRYNSGGLYAIFSRGEDAIDCGHSIVRAITIKNKQNKNLPVVRQRLSIMTGDVIFGIVGEDERKIPSIISNVSNILLRLDEICSMMSAKIVFTKSLLDILPLSYKFLYRHIGQITFGQEEIILFEDFQNRSRDMSNQMIKSKYQFERGVQYFTQGNYKASCEDFANALKICPQDKGAYVYYNKAKEKSNE